MKKADYTRKKPVQQLCQFWGSTVLSSWDLFEIVRNHKKNPVSKPNSGFCWFVNSFLKKHHGILLSPDKSSRFCFSDKYITWFSIFSDFKFESSSLNISVIIFNGNSRALLSFWKKRVNKILLAHFFYGAIWNKLTHAVSCSIYYLMRLEWLLAHRM